MGIELVGLLDSGSSRSLLGLKGWEICKSLGWTFKKTPEKYVTVANGNRCEVIGTIDIPIELEGRILMLNFLVVPTLNSSMILGIDFWRKIGIVPNFVKGTWMFNEEGIHSSSVITDPHIFAEHELSEDQRKRLLTVLDEYKGNQPIKLGCTDLVQHKIDTEGHEPIKQRYYPLSPSMQEIMDKELDKMLKEDIVEPSSSPWSSPVVLVKKPDSTYRFCVDYRKLNKVTKKDAYPLPYMTQILDRLRNAHYLSSIDIKSAYWQIMIHPDSRPKTAFTVPSRGLFQFKRMPFGLHNAPATWQRLIDSVLGADLEPSVFVYLDDIIIATADFEKHIYIVNEVLKRLKKAGLTLNWEKNQFCRHELRYLGYVVDSTGLRVDPAKVGAILDYPAPKNVKQVRSFLGIASWYRRFVPNFSQVATPLTLLIKKKSKWVWGEEQRKAFEIIKEKLISAPILTCPDFKRPFLVQTDASSTGLGAILSQEFPEGEKAIAYASRSLAPNEKKFTTTELECLAVIWATEKFRPYLEGATFTVITDHHSLVWLHNLKDPHGRLARWALKLQNYDFTIRHRPGKSHMAADALSRVPHTESIEAPEEITDKWYKRMRDRVLTEPQYFPDWCCEDGKVLRRIKDRRDMLETDNPWKIVVPKDERKKVLGDMHDDPKSGHLGSFKTFRRLKRKYYWPGYVSDVSRYVRMCEVCQKLKPEQKIPAGLMGDQRKVNCPWQIISIDLIGPLPRSSKQNKYILTVSDYFSKFTLLHPLRAASTSSIIKFLEEHIFLIFGVPQVVISDNGSQFRSKEFQKFIAEYKAKCWFTPYYHPQANPTERVNRVVKTMISAYVGEQHKAWDKELPKLAAAIRSATHEVTQYSPNYIVFGREVTTSGEDYPDCFKARTLPHPSSRETYVAKFGQLPLLYEDVKERLMRAYERNRRSYNTRRRPQVYNEGEVVWKKNYVLSDAAQGKAAKLEPKYVKAKVIQKISDSVYKLVNLEGQPIGTWHTKDLKPLWEENLEDFPSGGKGGM